MLEENGKESWSDVSRDRSHQIRSQKLKEPSMEDVNTMALQGEKSH
jgi:hypothetical protein